MRKIKILSFLMTIIILATTLCSCSNAPEYSEIEERFRQLVEDSYEINRIFFGEGLETYPRVSDPRNSTSVLEKKETDGSGNEVTRKIWYYYTLDKDFTVLAFRDSYVKPFTYVLQLKDRSTPEKVAELFPLLDEEQSSDDFYKLIYESEEDGIFCYTIPYAEIEYDFYYSAIDPEDYDYVTFDNEYKSISSIKEAAAKVYSAEYLNSIYGSAFTGISSAEGFETLAPRYIEYTDDYGSTLLMKSNTTKPLVSEKRIFLFDTAEIVRKSNANFVTIRIDSYLESTPENILTVKLTMIKENGQWFLDSGTY